MLKVLTIRPVSLCATTHEIIDQVRNYNEKTLFCLERNKNVSDNRVKIYTKLVNGWLAKLGYSSYTY